MNTKFIALAVLVAFAIGFGVGMAVQKKYSPCLELPVVSIDRDTVTVTDTIRGEVPKPQTRTIIRVDTLRLQINPKEGGEYETDTTTRRSKPDTLGGPRTGQGGEVLLPIEQRVYATPDYRAVVSGFRPSLDSIEVYRNTVTLTNTVTKYKTPRWALTAGGGVGYTPDKNVVPYVGVGVGLVLWSK